jgi:hypothetical protein
MIAKKCDIMSKIIVAQIRNCEILGKTQQFYGS